MRLKFVLPIGIDKYPTVLNVEFACNSCLLPEQPNDSVCIMCTYRKVSVLFKKKKRKEEKVCNPYGSKQKQKTELQLVIP